MQFTFTPANTLDLSTGTYYAHIVNSIPSDSATTVANLTITDAINYQPKILTGLVYTIRMWTFDNFAFPTYTYNTAPTGIVICKQIGSSPSSTDPIISYGDFFNILYQSIQITIGRYALSVEFPVFGILQFKDYYKYTSGAFINNEPTPKGLIYMLGSRNDTQAFISPRYNTILDINSTSTLDLIDRSNGSGVVDDLHAYEFGSRRIQVGIWAYRQPQVTGTTWTIWGSNTYNSGPLDIPSDWTPLGSSSSYDVGWNFVTCNNPKLWKTIKITAGGDTGFINQIEFYNSSMYSTHQNLMSTIIDSSFENEIVDNSGFNNTWAQFGIPQIENNALKLLNGSYIALTTPNTQMTHVTTRNFEVSFKFKLSSLAQTNEAGIVTWDGAEYPLFFKLTNGNYKHHVGDNFNSAIYTPGVNGDIGTPSQTTFDTISTNRVGSVFTTTVNNNTFTGSSEASVGEAPNICLGTNGGVTINGYIKDFKLIT